VSGVLSYIEPVCARLCAAREDRETEVVPHLRAAIEAQQAEFDDAGRYNANARRFHETLVRRCGSETMILVIGALETIWSAHETSVRDEASVRSSDGGPEDDAEPGPGSPLARRTRRAALRDHERLLTAIEAGNADRAFTLASAHLTATRPSTLATVGDAGKGTGSRGTIDANLVGGISLTPRHSGH
jgi:DNA-binding FadR family transcriptional regulator